MADTQKKEATKATQPVDKDRLLDLKIDRTEGQRIMKENEKIRTDGDKLAGW